MSKTPEEMAEEYASSIYRLKYYVDGRLKPSQGQEGFRWLAGKNGFLAGYKAAQQQYREAVEVLDKHKAAAEKAVTNIKNASDWVTIEKAKANENT